MEQGINDAVNPLEGGDAFTLPTDPPKGRAFALKMTAPKKNVVDPPGGKNSVADPALIILSAVPVLLAAVVWRVARRQQR